MREERKEREGERERERERSETPLKEMVHILIIDNEPLRSGPLA